MTPDSYHLAQSNNYTSMDTVIVGNDASLPISHTSNFSHVPNVYSLNVLIVPHLTKNILSISKLTSDYSLSLPSLIKILLYKTIRQEEWWQLVDAMEGFTC